ncbi:hypothetical protein DM01DRAFT_1335140, partial [Hesseltinella vesiculosa]
MATSNYYIRFRKPPPTSCRLDQPFTVVWDIESDLGDYAYELPLTLTCQTTDRDIQVHLLPQDTKSPLKAGTWDYVPYRGGGIVTRLALTTNEKPHMAKKKRSPAKTTSGSLNVQLVLSVAPAYRDPQSAEHPIWTNSYLTSHGDSHWIIGLASVPIALALSTSASTPSLTSADQVQRFLKAGSKIMHLCEDNEETIARHVWDCGLALCCYLDKEKASLSCKRVIELGSGTGLVGIYAAHVLQPTSVYLTDLPDAMAILEQNARLNPPSDKKKTKIHTKVLSWGPLRDDGADDEQESTAADWQQITAVRPFDLVLLADVLYNQTSHDILLDTLEWLSVDSTTKVILAYKQRNPDERVFFDKARARQFECSLLPFGPSPSVYEIYSLTKKQTPSI